MIKFAPAAVILDSPEFRNTLYAKKPKKPKIANLNKSFKLGGVLFFV